MSYQLELFYYPQCPFCQYVLETINELELKDITYSNTLENPAKREQLIQDTGRATVPCLYINGKPMHESSDIMVWLKKHRDELS